MIYERNYRVFPLKMMKDLQFRFDSGRFYRYLNIYRRFQFFLKIHLNFLFAFKWFISAIHAEWQMALFIQLFIMCVPVRNETDVNKSILNQNIHSLMAKSLPIFTVGINQFYVCWFFALKSLQQLLLLLLPTWLSDWPFLPFFGF